MQPTSRRRGGPGWALFFLPVVAIVLLALGGIVMMLWNYVLPPLVHLPQIDYFRALGLLLLCRILFGRIGGNGGPWRRGGAPWKQKWAAMSDEERTKFREGWKQRCAERKEAE